MDAINIRVTILHTNEISTQENKKKGVEKAKKNEGNCRDAVNKGISKGSMKKDCGSRWL